MKVIAMYNAYRSLDYRQVNLGFVGKFSVHSEESVVMVGQQTA